MQRKKNPLTMSGRLKVYRGFTYRSPQAPILLQVKSGVVVQLEARHLAPDHHLKLYY